MALINSTMSIVCTKFTSHATLTSSNISTTMRPRLLQPCLAMSTTPAAGNKLIEPTTTPVRRSANYKSSIWSFEQIQSLTNPYTGEKHVRRCEKLKQMVIEMFKEDQKELVNLLEFIDDLERLGLSYHFETQINQALSKVHDKFSRNDFHQIQEDNLYAKALAFRLLRQHGFHVSQEIFDCFKNDKGDFKTSLCEDTKGLLSLYEASYLSVNGEATMDMAREFTTMHLRKSLEDNKLIKDQNNIDATMVDHALELPLHWRIRRMEARWFIDVYERRADMNPFLLEFAKLDFNILQAIYQEELKDLTRWWKNCGITENFPYVRDCLVPSFFGIIGSLCEPQYGLARNTLVKAFVLVSMMDDTYDIYGTIDELHLYTDAINRWDINAIDELPYYMKVCFLLLHNYVSEVAYDALRDHGINTIPYIKKMWQDLCNAYLQEAKWYVKGYKPTLEEYKSNSTVSVGIPQTLIHAYVAVENSMKEEGLKAICNYHDVIRCSSNILRYLDDLETSSDEMERGDVPKLLQCFMSERGASEKEAHEYANHLISETWKELNELNLVPGDSIFSKTYIKYVTDMGRASHIIYQFGDGYGNGNSITQERISSTLFEPIPVEIM